MRGNNSANLSSLNSRRGEHVALKGKISLLSRNYSIKYLPVPILDIIQMKITEKDRLEKIQYLINKVCCSLRSRSGKSLFFFLQLDAVCARNQQAKASCLSNDSLIVGTTANLSREKTLLSDNQQQLIGDQASFEYVSSCSNRGHVAHDLTSTFNRSVQINKVCS